MLKKKYILKIPSNLNYVYCQNLNKLVLISHNQTKILNLNFKILINKTKNYFYVTNIKQNKLLDKKKLESLRMLDISNIRKTIIEISTILTKKLKLIGVGYKAFLTKNSISSYFLQLKLGYSHNIYIKIPNDVKLVCPKPDTILISSNSSISLNRLVSLIRSYKIPDIYKGKGILYEYEKIVLKTGKKS